MTLSLVSCNNTTNDALKSEISKRDTPVISEKYLKEYFNLILLDKTTTTNLKEIFTQIFPYAFEESEVSVADDAITYENAVIIFVTAADFDSLALTYSDEKADKKLSSYGLKIKDSQTKKYMATAFESGLYTADDVSKIKSGKEITKDDSINTYK